MCACACYAVMLCCILRGKKHGAFGPSMSVLGDGRGSCMKSLYRFINEDACTPLNRYSRIFFHPFTHLSIYPFILSFLHPYILSFSQSSTYLFAHTTLARPSSYNAHTRPFTYTALTRQACGGWR